MARTFNGSTQFLRRAEALNFTYPLTLALWVYPQRSSLYEDVLCLARSADNSTGWFLQLRGPDGMKAAAVTAYQNTFAIARSSTTFSLNRWCHLAGVFTAANSRMVYLDGVAGSVEGTTLAVPTVDRIVIGAWERQGSWMAYFAGYAAEAAVWKVALNASEIAQLAAGHSPLLVRPGDLIAYWPLGGPFGNDDRDHLAGLYDLTPFNSPGWTDHPSINYPQPEPPPPLPTIRPTPRFPAVAGNVWTATAGQGTVFCPGAVTGCSAGHVAAGVARNL